MLSGLGHKHRGRQDDEVDIDMVPIMNMFLVLIPFLLTSASFINLKLIHTSVPVLTQSASDDNSDRIRKNDIKVTAVVEMKKKAIEISVLSDSLKNKEKRKLYKYLKKRKSDGYPLDEMVMHLKKIKESYPLSDTMLLIPEGNMIYETIIQVMDAARYYPKEVPLFFKVVLSAKIE